MQTRMEALAAPAVAGGLVVLGGVALWQLGIEFERAWMRSYEEPLPGDSLPGDSADAARRADSAKALAPVGEHRRWVKPRHPRVMSRAAHAAF
jgi:hypothetical protein